MEYGIIKDYDLIQEDCKVEDLLDFSESIEVFTKILNSIERSSIIGLIGKFGCGKSTMLHQIKLAEQEKIKWIDFDAWKYPERKDLWEGFVLDFADQVGQKKKVQGKIEGKDPKSKIIGASTDILSVISNKWSDFGFLSKFVELFKSSPAKRVFEIQEVLKQIINSQKKDIYVVVEDIDRSGDAGIYFLETMKQFIRDTKFKKRIVVIVPIGDGNFAKYNDLYLKCLDYIEFFNPKIENLDKFVKSVFKDDMLNCRYAYPEITIQSKDFDCNGQVSSFFEGLFLTDANITMRLMKNIIRQTDLAYYSQVLDGHRPDWRVTLCIVAAKYLTIDDKSQKTHIEEFKTERKIDRFTIFASFLHSIVTDVSGIYYDDRNGQPRIVESKYDVKFIKRQPLDKFSQYPSKPWFYGRYSDENRGYGVCDFYLDY